MTPNAPHIFNQQEPRVTFIGIDLETTDSDPSRAKIVQFAALAQRQGQTLHEADFLIDPGCPIPAAATKIHHLTDEMVVGQGTIEKHAPKIVQLLARAGEPGSCLVGYNLRQYDLPLLTHALAVTVGTIGPAPMIVDVMDLISWHCRGFRSRKLWDVAQQLGIVAEGAAHDAKSDIRVTFSVLDKLRELMRLPESLDGDLHLMRMAAIAAVRVDAEYRNFAHYVYRDRDTWANEPSTFRLGFGQHTGRELGELRDSMPGYCRWLQENVIPQMPIAAIKAFGDAGYRVPMKKGEN